MSVVLYAKSEIEKEKKKRKGNHPVEKWYKKITAENKKVSIKREEKKKDGLGKHPVENWFITFTAEDM